MILADKIINERKKLGWSQEELADQLEVSRQSVSKWEGAQSTPDLNRILKMAELFGVSTDYLLKDEIAEISPAMIVEDTHPSNENVRQVSMEEATAFLSTIEKKAPWTALAVSLCIISPTVLIALAGISLTGVITETLAAAIGLAVLLLLIAIAVFIFIFTDRETKEFEYLEKVTIDTAYGVDGMVRDKKNKHDKKHTLFMAVGVILCIIAVIPLLVMGATLTDSSSEYILPGMVSVLLLVVALGVNLIIRSSMITESYDKLLQEGDFTPSGKKAAKTLGKVAGIYWSLVLGVYLAWSFITMKWEITWIIWPVTAVIYGAVVSIAKMILKEE